MTIAIPPAMPMAMYKVLPSCPLSPGFTGVGEGVGM